MENHETDYQRARRQGLEIKKHGITGATPQEATKRIKEHKWENGKYKGSLKMWQNSIDKIHASNKAKSEALKNKKGSFDKMNQERKRQGYKKNSDRASKVSMAF